MKEFISYSKFQKIVSGIFKSYDVTIVYVQDDDSYHASIEFNGCSHKLISHVVFRRIFDIKSKDSRFDVFAYSEWNGNLCLQLFYKFGDDE